MRGYSENRFNPQKPLSRAEALTIALRLVDSSKRVPWETLKPKTGYNTLESLGIKPVSVDNYGNTFKNPSYPQEYMPKEVHMITKAQLPLQLDEYIFIHDFDLSADSKYIIMTIENTGTYKARPYIYLAGKEIGFVASNPIKYREKSLGGNKYQTWHLVYDNTVKPILSIDKFEYFVVQQYKTGRTGEWVAISKAEALK